MNFSLFVNCPKGLEYLLEEELKSLGLQSTRVSPYGVFGEANLLTLYQICLWTRIANRVQLVLFNGQAHNDQSLYQLCHQFPWQTVFSADKTLAIDFHGSSKNIRNSMFGAQVVKDAIVDHFRKLQGNRPTIEKDRPQILLHAHLKDEGLTVSFDLAGYSLHQRGYRKEAGGAPLKENVAAAVLLRANWPQLAEEGFALHDPFCGSGTLVIEAAMMAAHVAPGLLRNDQSLIYWNQHQAPLWEKIRSHALQQIRTNTQALSGSDRDARQITMARSNADRAGVARLVQFKVCSVENGRAEQNKGLLLSNPPYGERLGEVAPLVPVYKELGQVLRSHYPGWRAGVLTSNPMLAKATGLHSPKQYAFFNGNIECKLYLLNVPDAEEVTHKKEHRISKSAQMFANRLQKNFKHLEKWAKRQGVSCYRVYDADLPEYAYAIDMYNDYAVLQEYKAPASVPQYKIEKHSLDVISLVPDILHIPPDHLVVKQRQQQKGMQQYQKMDKTKHKIMVQEGKATFLVNLKDYLDTGLFLDHRLLRMKFSQLPKNARFLNCFCYTASASIHAALAGAWTTNVDLSKTYLSWAEENFRLNHIPLSRHQFIQEDCIKWLKTTRDKFDVIFLDPPSFSNSKRMKQTLDVQRDQETLISSAMRLLTSEGVLYFSTNLRSFKLSTTLEASFDIQDISKETIDEDFKRNKRIHHCFLIKPKTAGAVAGVISDTLRGSLTISQGDSV